MTPDPTRGRTLRDLVGELPGLDLDHAGPSQCAVLHSADRTRIDARGGVYGADVSFLLDGDGVADSILEFGT